MKKNNEEMQNSLTDIFFSKKLNLLRLKITKYDKGGLTHFEALGKPGEKFLNLNFWKSWNLENFSGKKTEVYFSSFVQKKF